MAIRFVDHDGKHQTLAGHDPKVKGRLVNTALPSKGFRTKGPDAEANRIAALEAEVRALQAKNERLQAERVALNFAARTLQGKADMFETENVALRGKIDQLAAELRIAEKKKGFEVVALHSGSATDSSCVECARRRALTAARTAKSRRKKAWQRDGK